VELDRHGWDRLSSGAGGAASERGSPSKDPGEGP
jgi:hypothetical protein